ECSSSSCSLALSRSLAACCIDLAAASTASLATSINRFIAGALDMVAHLSGHAGLARQPVTVQCRLEKGFHVRHCLLVADTVMHALLQKCFQLWVTCNRFINVWV